MPTINPKISSQIWCLKIIAIFTIFFAHMPLSDKNVLSDNYMFVRLFSLLGMVVVPIFFIISGYLYKSGKILNKAQNLLIPLVIWGFATYVLHCFNLGLSSFSIKDLVLWILGYNCYLYFVPVLFTIILLYNIYDNDYIWIFIGVICVGLYQMHIIKYSGGGITPYMNPLNFIPYFAIGHLIRKKNIWEQIQSTSISLISLLIVIVMFSLTQIYTHVWYFELYSFLVNIAFAAFLISITKYIEKISDNLLILGKCTFVIYLCHMPIATTFNKVLPRFLTGYLEPIKILVAFSFVSAVVYVGYNILKRLRCDKIMLYLGYRK